MLNEKFDKMLAAYFNKSSSNNRLDQLERDVWKKIHFRENEEFTSWHNTVLLVFNMPKFQVSSVAFALLVGLVLSPIIALEFKKEVNQAPLDLSVFKINAPYLTTNLIEQTK